ncbi:MAG TPA: ABC transporter transmembrane domain-containing protein [Cellvibrio sp.]|nr:ABC transporter transmembrane domain-containing protein [Cellvibrio sp.]
MDSSEIIDKFFHKNISPIQINQSSDLSSAVYSLLNKYDVKVDKDHVASFFIRYSISNDMDKFIEGSKYLGADFCLINLDTIEEINDSLLPCITKINNDYVIVTKAKQKYFHIYNPNLGEYTVAAHELDKTFGKKVIYIKSIYTDSSKNEKVIGLRELYRNVSGFKETLAKLFLLALFIQVFAFFLPLFAQLTIDNIIPNYDKWLLMIIAIGFISVVVIDSFVKIVAGLVTTNLLVYLNSNTLVSVFDHLVHLPSSFFDGRQMGDILSRFKSIEPLNGKVTKSLVEIIIDSLMTVTMSIVMLIYAPFIAFISLICFILIMAIRFGFNSTLKDLERNATERYAESSSYFIETFNSMQSIRVLQAESKRRDQWLERHVKAIRYDQHRIKLALTIDNIADMINGIEMIVVIALSALYVIESSMTLGAMFAYLSYRTLFSTHASRLIKNISDLRILNIYLSRISTILNHRRINYTQSDFINADDFSGRNKISICFEKVSYKQSNTNKLILKDVSFQISFGELVCIEGDSGAGKSTLIKLMLGILSPNTGVISINGIELNPFEKHSRTNCAAVLQGDRIFDISIAKNIIGASSEIDMERIIDCCKKVNMHDEIMQLSAGYETILQRNEMNISVGQEKRILLARALYLKPQILFLDEITSNLDRSNELLINNLIKSLHITRIVIDHRKFLSAKANKIITLDKGEIEINHANHS